jgi:hypothetical protein
MTEQITQTLIETKNTTNILNYDDLTNIYDDYEQMKKSQPAANAGVETAEGRSNDSPIQPGSPARPIPQELGAVPKVKKVNSDDISTIFDENAQMKKLLKSPKQLLTNDSRNDTIFLQALAYSNKSASQKKSSANELETTTSTASIISNIGSECENKLDEIESYMPDADLLANTSDSISSCSTTEGSETTDSGEESDYFDDDDGQQPEMPVSAYVGTNVNEMYQQSYALWSNMFWNQTTKILDYVKYTNYINDSNAELME